MLDKNGLLTIVSVTGQLQEMEMIRQKVYQLEQAQIKMKQEYVSTGRPSKTMAFPEADSLQL